MCWRGYNKTRFCGRKESCSLGNDVLACGAIAWTLAQVIKVLISWRLTHKMNWKRFFGMGGMPSSHTAFFVSVTMMVAYKEGFSSSVFAVAAGVAMVVIYDAMGVRYQTGQQSKVINQILREFILNGKKLTEKNMLELVGHTPLEVLFGAVIGFAVPLFYQLF